MNGTAKPKQFNWDEVYARRRGLAAKVQGWLDLSFPLTADVEGSFSFSSRMTDQFLADQPMWRVPFYVIASRMEYESQRRIIDHAWWLIADDRSGEPWGFVTEPYVELKEAQSLARSLTRRHQDWGIKVRALSPEDSAWNPGQCTPIVTTSSVGCLSGFLRLGVAATLEQL